MTNRLFYGDCLPIMQQQIKKESIDLIYLDPPFNSSRDYNAIYKDETGKPLPEQVQAFTDTWKPSRMHARILKDLPVRMLRYGFSDASIKAWTHLMESTRSIDDSLFAYLTYMSERIVEMKELLKNTGSIYLHCDPSASHSLKMMMDCIFGGKNFINEIIWSYKTGGASRKHFSKKHDVILLYGKTSKYMIDVPKEKSYTKSKNRKPGIVNYVAGTAEFFKDEKGVYNLVNMKDTWEISYVGSTSPERIGYATQKPLALLDRIVKASSKKGDVVFDPFCGCATTLQAAHELGREWIGIDISIHAVKRVAKIRLQSKMGLTEDEFTMTGIPRTMEGAVELWKSDAYHFQRWIVEEVDGFVAGKRSNDRGIDGTIYFRENISDEELKRMLIEVKGGATIPKSVIRDLRGVLEREEARMAGLIVLHSLGDRKLENFNKEASYAGEIEIDGEYYPRIQILTVEQILDGKKFRTPGKVIGKELEQPVAPGLVQQGKTKKML